jgi:hypothetical protein
MLCTESGKTKQKIFVSFDCQNTVKLHRNVVHRFWKICIFWPLLVRHVYFLRVVYWRDPQWVCERMCSCVYVCVCVCICVCASRCVYWRDPQWICVRMLVCMCVCMHVFMYVHHGGISEGPTVSMCMHACVYVCMCVFLSEYGGMYVWGPTVNLCMYACMYACMYFICLFMAGCML